MIDALHIKYLQFTEHLNADGFFKTAWYTLYKSEEVVTTIMDLSSIKPIEQKANHLDVAYHDLKTDADKTICASHSKRSRAKKCLNYLNQGYRAFCATNDGNIIADIWYASPATRLCSPVHPHVKLFNFELNESDVYMFDMFVTPEHRGAGFATEFMHRSMCHMRDTGFLRSYGYFSTENISALWTHRILGHKELNRFKMERFFVHLKATPVSKS